MKFYNEKEQMCLETDASGVDLRPSLLSVRDGMYFQRNEAHNKAALWAIAFASKHLKKMKSGIAILKDKPQTYFMA